MKTKRIHICLRRQAGSVAPDVAISEIEDLTTVTNVDWPRLARFGIMTCDVPEDFNLQAIEMVSGVESVNPDFSRSI